MKILVIDDDQSFCESMREYFDKPGTVLDAAFDASQGLSRTSDFQPDCILLDLLLGDATSENLIQQLRQISAAPIIVVSAVGEIRHAVACIKAGAEDFLSKPFDLDELSGLIEKVRSLKGAPDLGLALPNVVPYLQLSSPAMTQAYEKMEQIAAIHEAPVLVFGETGTGKEPMAQLLHVRSGRSKFPIVEVNCATIPETIFDSQIFGHEAGAFTDARSRFIGLLEQAQGGSIFFDEVGELPLGVQSKLLRVIETKVMRRLGGSKDIKLDVRILAATNRDLKGEMEAGRFRKDLYYRLCGYQIFLPPLRQSPQDLEALAHHFYKLACERHKKPCNETIRPDFMKFLLAHPWHGNIRELKDFIYLAVIDGSIERPGRKIDIPEISGFPDSPEDTVTTFPTRREAELKHARAVLERHGGNQSETARELGISRVTLAKMLKN